MYLTPVLVASTMEKQIFNRETAEQPEPDVRKYAELATRHAPITGLPAAIADEELVPMIAADLREMRTGQPGPAEPIDRLAAHGFALQMVEFLEPDPYDYYDLDDHLKPPARWAEDAHAAARGIDWTPLTKDHATQLLLGVDGTDPAATALRGALAEGMRSVRLTQHDLVPEMFGFELISGEHDMLDIEPGDVAGIFRNDRTRVDYGFPSGLPAAVAASLGFTERETIVDTEWNLTKPRPWTGAEAHQIVAAIDDLQAQLREHGVDVDTAELYTHGELAEAIARDEAAATDAAKTSAMSFPSAAAAAAASPKEAGLRPGVRALERGRDDSGHAL